MVKGCKACPICGYKEPLVAGKMIFPRSLLRRWHIRCDNCNFCGKTTMTLRGAKRAWNKGARDDRQRRNNSRSCFERRIKNIRKQMNVD